MHTQAGPGGVGPWNGQGGNVGLGMDQVSVVAPQPAAQQGAFDPSTDGQRADALNPAQPAFPQSINIVIENNNVLGIGNANTQQSTCAKSFTLKYGGLNKYGAFNSKQVVESTYCAPRPTH